MKNNTLINKIIEILLERKWDISIVESSTGGLLTSSFFGLDNVSISNVFKGAVIVNDEDSKINLCSVKTLTIEKHGETSKEVAVEMAYGLKNKLKTNVSVAVASSVDFDENSKDNGFVYFCIIIQDMIYDFEMIIPDSGKQKNRIIVSQKVLEEIYKSLVNF
ncbi:MAG: CinA family protein [Mycoplasmoidaceae bacterium]